ncbi:DUF555 domain-containing protein [Halospeciosus flavus]|uniref:UPF0212 protein ACFQJ9_06860 n=1 Tax=Halospeciosus flavus TaxID=3032283 RepID=A0ABD5Z1T7_9EURY|nr:DUF555 domain-containing protein [Halospeciosus flavus]
MDRRVVVEAAVPVYDVSSPDEAVRIAIAKTGEMLNPDLSYVEIEMGERTCPHCSETLDPAFLAADESLVALELEMTVFDVDRDEHAARIARKEIGQRMENVPLDVLTVDAVEEIEAGAGGEGSAAPDDGTTAGAAGTGDDADDLPEFDDLVDE